VSRGLGSMQRRVFAVLEAHEAATQHIVVRGYDSGRHRVMHKNEIAAAIFGAEHRLTASESSSLRRALGKLYDDKRIGCIYSATYQSTLWTANRRWALEHWLEWAKETARLLGRTYVSRNKQYGWTLTDKGKERLAARIAEVEAELSAP
jgi:hypothetical protein